MPVVAFAVFAVTTLSAWPGERAGAEVRGQEQVRIRVVDYPRPVAAAVRQAEQQFGWVVTYEDARYVHAGDIVDVTEQVSRDRASSKRILGMRRGSINVTLTPQSGSVEYQVAEVLDKVFADSVANGNAGEFGAIRVDGGYHVVPVAIKGQTGLLEQYSSPLDTRITLPLREESGLEAMARLADAITAQSGTKVVPGTMPLNRFHQARVSVSARNEVARDILWHMLKSISDDLSWQMLCAAGQEGLCAVNVHSVRRR